MAVDRGWLRYDQSVIDINTPNYDFSYAVSHVFRAENARNSEFLLCKLLSRYDQKVIEIWPEFGRHGKESITVRDVMRHEAGQRHSNPD